MTGNLSRRWPLADGADLRDELLAAYSSTQRGYHDATHLGEVLTRLDELAAHGVVFDEPIVQLAAWFHDAVYVGGTDDEEQSAQWAELALLGLVPDPLVDEVARLVRLTVTHIPADGDQNGAALCDADLAILAAPPDRYAQYAGAVRAEYRHVSDHDFARGRVRILRQLTAKPHLFHSPHARDLWEQPARANLDSEVRALDEG